MAPSDPTMWLCATVRTLQRRVFDLETQLRESKSAFANHHPFCEASVSHSVSVEKSDASASLSSSVRCAPTNDCEDDDCDDLADFHGFAEHGDQWVSYLEGDISKLEPCDDGRDDVLDFHHEAHLPVPASPLCHAPCSTVTSSSAATLTSQSVCKQVRFSAHTASFPRPQDVDREATSVVPTAFSSSTSRPHDVVLEATSVAPTASSTSSTFQPLDYDSEEREYYEQLQNLYANGRDMDKQRISAVSQRMIDEGKLIRKMMKKDKQDKMIRSILKKLPMMKLKRYCFVLS